MFLLGIKVLHAVFPHFFSVVLVHRSATRAFSRVIRFTSLSNTQVRPHSPLQGLQNLIRTSQSLFSNFCGLPVGKIAEKVPPSGNLNGAYMNKYRPTTDRLPRSGAFLLSYVGSGPHVGQNFGELQKCVFSSEIAQFLALILRPEIGSQNWVCLIRNS